MNFYVAAELLWLCPLKQLARLPAIPAFLQELSVWEGQQQQQTSGAGGGGGGGRKGGGSSAAVEGVAATLARSAVMLEGFRVLLNRNFYSQCT